MATIIPNDDGILRANTIEFNRHLADCFACQRDAEGNTLGTQHRPHTGNAKCWCVPTNTFNQCIIDRKYWHDLPEVDYIA
jgi:hypothetical protein